MRPKIQIKSTSTSPFAGLYFFLNFLEKKGIIDLIDRELGNRGKKNSYKYSDILKNYWSIFMAGGNHAEDLKGNLGQHLQSIPDNRMPSPDTLLRGLIKLSTENDVVTSKQGIKYDFNRNQKLNKLNLKILLLTKQLKSGKSYTLDYDNQVIATNKYDAKPTYKHVRGYMPGVIIIDDKIVYVENRQGNANVKLDQATTLRNGYKMLSDNNIKIYRSRMDAGSYAKDIVEVVAENSELFYIRANKSEAQLSQILEIKDWQMVEINHRQIEVASIPFEQFFAEREYRLVVSREKVDTNQMDLFTGHSYVYRSILTNDKHSTEQQIIEFYNQRGTAEKLFDVMNNDFGWADLPFSFMNQNTAFMLIMAILKNIYNVFVRKVAKVFADIKPSSRLKAFIFRFITVTGKWVKRARQWYLILHTNKPYPQLIT